MHEQLPHRFRESSFRKYEWYIAQAVEAFPATIAVMPRSLGISSITFACRCRDAIKSHRDYNWTPSTVHRGKFEDCAPYLVVSERSDGSILMGSREAIIKHATDANSGAFSVPAPSEATVSGEVLTLSTKEQKDLIMLLSHRRLLQPKLFLTGLTDPEVAAYQQRYDIAIDKHDDTTYILI